MPRQRRDLESSPWLHVLNRGCDRQDIYRTSADRLLFEQLLGEAFARFGVSLHAYALMTNHFHLLVDCTDDDVSAAMQRLTGRYASAFNDRHDRTGHLFTDRFRSVPIVSERQLGRVGRYIHRNPLAFVPEAALAAYRWSSLGVFLGRRACPSWLTTTALLPDGDGEAYLARILDEQAPPRPSCDDVVAAVAAVADVDRPAVLGGGRGAPNPARAMAVLLAVELGAEQEAQFAERFGVKNARGVRQIARRARRRLDSSPAFAELRREALVLLKLSPSGSVPAGLNRLRSA